MSNSFLKQIILQQQLQEAPEDRLEKLKEKIKKHPNKEHFLKDLENNPRTLDLFERMSDKELQDFLNRSYEYHPSKSGGDWVESKFDSMILNSTLKDYEKSKQKRDSIFENFERDFERAKEQIKEMEKFNPKKLDPIEIETPPYTYNNNKNLPYNKPDRNTDIEIS